MSKNPIFQERKKNVKKPYFSGEKKKSQKTLVKKNFLPYFSGEKKNSKNPTFTAKFIVKKSQKNLKNFSSKKWLKIFEKNLLSKKKVPLWKNFKKLSWNIKYFDFVTKKKFLVVKY